MLWATILPGTSPTVGNSSEREIFQSESNLQTGHASGCGRIPSQKYLKMDPGRHEVPIFQLPGRVELYVFAGCGPRLLTGP